MAAPMYTICSHKRAFVKAQLKRRAAAAAVVACVCEEKQSRSRRLWKKPFLLQHDDQGAYMNLVKELGADDERSFVNFLRLDPAKLNDLAHRIEPIVGKQDTNFHKSVPTKERLAVTLRFLATGESYKSLSYMFRLGATTIGDIVPETCRALYAVLKDDYLKMPESCDDWLQIAQKFLEKWNFPHTLGAIDGKHVALNAPVHSGSVFYNYKHFFSIVLMALVDADYKFIYVDVGCNGRVSDGGVFAGCTLAESLEKHLANIPASSELPGGHGMMSYHIVGDEAFPLRDYLMKPFPFRNLTQEQRVYNYRLSRARRVVENAFGILCSRFRVLLSRIALSPEKVEAIVLCCCVLHNYLISGEVSASHGSEALLAENGDLHQTADTTPLQSCGFPHSNFSGYEPKQKRERLMQFCNSPEGAVGWQGDMVA